MSRRGTEREGVLRRATRDARRDIVSGRLPRRREGRGGFGSRGGAERARERCASGGGIVSRPRAPSWRRSCFRASTRPGAPSCRGGGCTSCALARRTGEVREGGREGADRGWSASSSRGAEATRASPRASRTRRDRGPEKRTWYLSAFHPATERSIPPNTIFLVGTLSALARASSKFARARSLAGLDRASSGVDAGAVSTGSSRATRTKAGLGARSGGPPSVRRAGRSCLARRGTPRKHPRSQCRRAPSPSREPTGLRLLAHCAPYVFVVTRWMWASRIYIFRDCVRM